MHDAWWTNNRPTSATVPRRSVRSLAALAGDVWPLASASASAEEGSSKCDANAVCRTMARNSGPSVHDVLAVTEASAPRSANNNEEEAVEEEDEDVEDEEEHEEEMP